MNFLRAIFQNYAFFCDFLIGAFAPFIFAFMIIAFLVFCGLPVIIGTYLYDREMGDIWIVLNLVWLMTLIGLTYALAKSLA